MADEYPKVMVLGMATVPERFWFIAYAYSKDEESWFRQRGYYHSEKYQKQFDEEHSKEK